MTRTVFDAKPGDEVRPSAAAVRQNVFGKTDPGTGLVINRTPQGHIAVRWPHLSYDSFVHTDWLELVPVTVAELVTEIP